MLALQPVAGAERENRVLATQRIYSQSVCVRGKFVLEQAVTEPANLVLVEIPDELTHQLGPRVFGRVDTVRPQALEHVGAIPKAPLPISQAAAPSPSRETHRSA